MRLAHWAPWGRIRGMVGGWLAWGLNPLWVLGRSLASQHCTTPHGLLSSTSSDRRLTHSSGPPLGDGASRMWCTRGCPDPKAACARDIRGKMSRAVSRKVFGFGFRHHPQNRWWEIRNQGTCLRAGSICAHHSRFRGHSHCQPAPTFVRKLCGPLPESQGEQLILHHPPSPPRAVCELWGGRRR